MLSRRGRDVGPLRRAHAAVAALVCLAAADARAEDRAEPEHGSARDLANESAERAALPPFMSKKRRMRADDIEDKNEGGYFTGLPLVNSDPDTGFGFGARVLYFNNGRRDDVKFAYTPYRHRVYAQAFFTTNGLQFHTLDYDGTYVGDTPFRVRATLLYEKNTAANYFGVGARSMGRLRFSGDDRSFTKFDEYTEALRAARPDGTSYTRYDKYILTRPLGTATVERDFLGGILRAQAGLTASWVGVRTWDRETVSADAADGSGDVDARQASTRLGEDCAVSRVVGCGGGFNNALKLGLALDTRDLEPNPNSGAFVELTTELSGRPVGSDFDWVRTTLSGRYFYSPFPKLADVVLAARVVGSVQTADTPFFSQNTLSFTDLARFGLGGRTTLRGFKQDRYVGRVSTLASFEVRWTFAEIKPLRRQHFAFMLVPFIDAGRVFDSIDDFELARFRTGQGAGLRIAWNQATVIIADFGVGREGAGLYINFNHPF